MSNGFAHEYGSLLRVQDRFRFWFPVESVIAVSEPDLTGRTVKFAFACRPVVEHLFRVIEVIAEEHDIASVMFDDSCIENEICLERDIIGGQDRISCIACYDRIVHGDFLIFLMSLRINIERCKI